MVTIARFSRPHVRMLTYQSDYSDDEIMTMMRRCRHVRACATLVSMAVEYSKEVIREAVGVAVAALSMQSFNPNNEQQWSTFWKAKTFSSAYRLAVANHFATAYCRRYLTHCDDVPSLLSLS